MILPTVRRFYLKASIKFNYYMSRARNICHFSYLPFYSYYRNLALKPVFERNLEENS